MSEKKQRELRVRCLVLDHDDTVVKKYTGDLNFPGQFFAVTERSAWHDYEL